MLFIRNVLKKNRKNKMGNKSYDKRIQKIIWFLKF